MIDVPSIQIFGVDGSELMGPDEAEIIEPDPPTIGNMTQEEFAEEMVGLINYVMDFRENREEQTEDQGFVLGGGGGSSAALDAILME